MMVEVEAGLISEVIKQCSDRNRDELLRAGMRVGREISDGFVWLWAIGTVCREHSLMRLATYFCASAPEDHWGIPLVLFDAFSRGDLLADEAERANVRINLCTAIQSVALDTRWRLLAPFIGWFLVDALRDGHPEPAQSAFETLELLDRFEFTDEFVAGDVANSLCVALTEFTPVDEDDEKSKQALIRKFEEFSHTDLVLKPIPSIDGLRPHVASMRNLHFPEVTSVISNLFADAIRYIESHNLAVDKRGHVLEGRLSWLPDFDALASFQRFISFIETMMNGREVLSTTVGAGSLVVRVCGTEPARGLDALVGTIVTQKSPDVADVVRKALPLLTEIVASHLVLDLRTVSPAGGARSIVWRPSKDTAEHLLERAAEVSVETYETHISAELVAADSQSGRVTLLSEAEAVSGKVLTVDMLNGTTIGNLYHVEAEVRRTYSAAKGENVDLLISALTRQDKFEEASFDTSARFAESVIPQSVKPSRLVSWVRQTGAMGRPATGFEIGLNSRRATYYYLSGAKALGLISPDGKLTTAGHLVASMDTDEEALDLLAICFANSPLVSLLLEFAGVENLVDVSLDHARPFLAQLGLSGETLKSRAGTLRSWLRTFKPRLPQPSRD